jgi:regulator of protease activity HflC (stomatin/prohibitin superfamily)
VGPPALSADVTSIAVGGQLTFRVSDPLKLSTQLDYSLDRAGDHESEDPEKLPERLIAALHTRTRGVIGRMGLREALAGSEPLAIEVLGALRAAEDVTSLGVEVLGLSILGIRPTPEAAKALEAETREALQRRSDEAIYARRNAAVEQERRIKESELETERAIEERRQKMRESQMSAEIALELQRAALIEQRVENEKKDADAKAYALTVALAPIGELDWRKVMMLSPGGADPGTSIAMAFQEMAANAQKIGELNVSPDLLRALIK